MIEKLILASILLSDEEKKSLLLKAQSATEAEKKHLEKVLSEEKDYIALLFHEYGKRSEKGSLACLKGSLGSFDIELIREREQEEMKDEVLPTFI